MAGMAQFEIMMITLPVAAYSGDIVPELRRLPQDGDVRLVDLLLVRKDAAGRVTVTEPPWPGGPGLRHRGDIVSLLAGLGPERMHDWDIVAALPAGQAAAIAVVEHCWAAPLLDAVESAGGVHLVDDVVVVEFEEPSGGPEREVR